MALGHPRCRCWPTTSAVPPLSMLSCATSLEYPRNPVRNQRLFQLWPATVRSTAGRCLQYLPAHLHCKCKCKCEVDMAYPVIRQSARSALAYGIDHAIPTQPSEPTRHVQHRLGHSSRDGRRTRHTMHAHGRTRHHTPLHVRPAACIPRQRPICRQGSENSHLNKLQPETA